ncbi:hypothetical protein JXB28_06380 [Candidatus Woesearchaeota archaeon]|nr:hypothetical protein [Candidatus Woesearchaeota archaeon]
MRKASFVLCILVFVIFLLSISSLSGEASTPPIHINNNNGESNDGAVFFAYDTVELSINLMPEQYPLYELSISKDNNSYTYRGDFNPIMFFYPTEEGIYTTALVEKSTGAIFYSLQFTVLAKQGLEAVDDVISRNVPMITSSDIGSQGPALSAEHGDSSTPETPVYAGFVYTNKKRYEESESVRIWVDAPGYQGISLYYSFAGEEKRYMGDLAYINFMPQGAGTHTLILKDAHNLVIDEYSFEVLAASAKGFSETSGISKTIMIKDSKGASESIVANIIGESNGFGNIRISLGKGLVSSVKEIELKNVQLTKGSIPLELSIGLEDIDISSSGGKVNINQRTAIKAFAIDPTSLNFSEGIVTGVAIGTELWKCKDWNFAEQACYGDWIKLMDLVPSSEYSFTLTPDDPGFAETSPSIGTADIGSMMNITYVNYIDGTVNDTQTDNNGFWAAGVDNPGNRRYNPVGYLNMTYNLSAIGLISVSQVFDLTFNISYCHSSDTTTPTICAVLGTPVTYRPSNVEVLNYSSGTYVIIGTLPLRNGTEGMNNYSLNSSNTNLSQFISNNLISIRYGINFSIGSNGYDALLAIDYAPLTVRFDNAPPAINYTSPTDTSGQALSRNYILVNVTANDTNLKNITIYLYNATWALASSSSTTTASFLFANFTGLSDGRYYFNATAYDTKNNFNYTADWNVTLDTHYPQVNYSSGTEGNNTYFNRNWIYVNVSVNETNEVNITFRLFNRTSPVNVTTLGAGNRSINFTGLDSNAAYWYNVTVIDIVGLQNTTETRKITLDSTFPTINLLAPGNDTFRNSNSTLFNYSAIDNNLDACTLYGNFTAPFGPNETDDNPVNGSNSSFGPIILGDGKYLWNVWCNDSASNSNFSQYNYTLKIDTQKPVISNWSINGTSFSVSSYICLNVSVADSFSGAQSVYAEIKNPNDVIANFTMLDDGSGCDSLPGDSIFSYIYYNEFAGNYTWLYTHAKDYANNTQANLTSLTWNVTTTGSMNVTMTYPASDLEINESEYNYEYQQSCNVSCDPGGADCYNVTLYAQYQPLAVFENINTTTIDLINADDWYSCGDLVSGGAVCTYTFNITSGSNSGNHTWPIRCSATSDNVGTFVSSSVNLIINDHPYANFTYPYENAWLSGIEMLNGSASFDSDGTITSYLFEYDNTTAFDSPSTICSSSSHNCTWNTSQQGECENNSLSCFLRLSVWDDNGLSNSTYLTIGFDTQAPTTNLGLPRDHENISLDFFYVNASATDDESGVHTVIFEYRQNSSDSWHLACTDSIGPEYNCTWDLSSLADGSEYEFRAYANDSKGNIGASDNHTAIKVNRTAPVITLLSPPDNSSDTDGNIVFAYQVNAFNGISNCTLIINNTVNQTNDSVQRGIEQYFYLYDIGDGAQLNWSINCTDLMNRTNSSKTWNITVNINTNMNLNLSLDNTSYYAGDDAIITHNVTDAIGAGIASVDLGTAIVLANTTVPWWNSSWQRRKPLILNSSENLVNALVEVNITGLSGNITSCANEIRIVRFNSSTATLTSINRTIVGGDDSSYCIVRFRANITGVNNTDYMAYYNDSAAANPNNDEAWLTLNLTKAAIAGNITGSQYDVIDGSYIDTIDDNATYYAVGMDNNPPTGYPLDAFVNLTYNLSGLGVEESNLVSFNFTLNYCHSNDITPPITCGDAIGAGTPQTAYVQLYDFEATGWAAGFDTISQDTGAPSEVTGTYAETANLGNYVDNSTGILFVSYETNITGLDRNDDASFAIDYSLLNVFYKEKIYALGVSEPSQALVASNSSSTDINGLWTWNWSTASVYPGNYSAVSLATKQDYNNAYDYYWFQILAANVSIDSIMVDDDADIPVDEIDLQAGTTKLVYCNITASETRDYTYILGVNATLYSTTVAYDAADDNRTHYTNSSCTFLNGGGQSADYQCVFNVWHFAINGTWECMGFATNGYASANKTDNTTVNQLFALNISTNTIDYAELEANQQSANITVNISNVGNMPMNISVYGFGGEDEAAGSGLSMVCEINNISISFQRFATDSSSDYASKNTLDSTPQGIGLTIPPKSASEEIKINSTYWQLMIPPESQSFGRCNGSVVFVAESP